MRRRPLYQGLCMPCRQADPAGQCTQGGSEKLSDEEIEATLEKVVRLLAYISDKDLFAEFFRKKLARRLLQEKSSSDEHERSILTRLKEQCGAQFTSKVQHSSLTPSCVSQAFSCCLGAGGPKSLRSGKYMCTCSHGAEVLPSRAHLASFDYCVSE